MRDPHTALKTEVVSRVDSGSIELVLMRLRHGKDDTEYSLHARPYSYTSAGVQTTDLLGYLGFRSGPCSFLAGGRCYARPVPNTFQLDGFGSTLPAAYKLLESAEHHFESCGIYLEHPEGYGFFHGRESHPRQREYLWDGGDGHTSSTVKRMKEAEDKYHRYVFTWIEVGGKKGWVTHYAVKEGQSSPELVAAMSLIKGRPFRSCPEFDFDPCSWRFFAYRGRDHGSFDGGAEAAHRGFDSHTQHFAPALDALMKAHSIVQPFGMKLLPTKTPDTRRGGETGVASPGPAKSPTKGGVASRTAPAATKPRNLRILFLAANPMSTSRLDLEEELHAVERELRAVKFRDHVTLVSYHGVRPDDLLRHVRNTQPNVIHFSGHGSPAGIMLRTDSGGHQPVSGDSLRRFLDGRGVELVVLNACFTDGQARDISASVPSVVGTSSSVEDEASRRFSVAFYRALGDGLSIREAFRDGGDAVALHGLTDVFSEVGELDRTLVGT